MRRLFALCLLVLAAPAQAATLDPSRIAAIEQAADAFLAKAAAAKKTGMVPRQSDPEIGPLLDTVLDTRDLAHGTLPYADFDKLHNWLSHIIDVGQVYVVASRPLHDLGIFGPEVGRYFDAVITASQAIADMMAAELAAHPAGEPPGDLAKTADMRAKITGNVAEIVGGLGAPGVTIGWDEERLIVLVGAAPSLTRFLKPADLERLRRTALGLAAKNREKSMRAAVARFAVALTTPAAPTTLAGDTVPPSGEIALSGEAGEFTVPVRINDARTVKFVIDSGAAVVSLPKELVDSLLKGGAMAASDVLGREDYLAADGHRHKGMRLVLRRIEVGGHIATNVRASMSLGNAPPLLGMSFLSKFKSWTLDNRRHVLIISE